MKQIYVHGLGQTSDSWTKTIDILQTTDYSLCPNLPDLVHSKEVTYDNLYAAFSDYCNQYDEPIDLCGLSLGGVLALNYAIQYPKKVRSLVLIATQYKMPKKLLKFQNLLFRFMPKSMFQQIVKERIEGGANEKAVLGLFINCPFVCINFDFFWLNKARQLYMDF